MDDAPSIAESDSTARLLAEVAGGRESALAQLLAEHRPYVRQVIHMRIDPVLRARVDPSDVVQEALVAASQKIGEFLDRRPTTFRLWLRGQALDRLIDAHRRHVRQKRDARRDVSLNDASSLAILGGLAGGCPREELLRRELVVQVQAALATLGENDREILLLRHGEQLSMAEAGVVLNISAEAASKRYGRAALRLVGELKRRGVTHRSNV